MTRAGVGVALLKQYAVGQSLTDRQRVSLEEVQDNTRPQTSGSVCHDILNIVDQKLCPEQPIAMPTPSEALRIVFLAKQIALIRYRIAFTASV